MKTLFTVLFTTVLLVGSVQAQSAVNLSNPSFELPGTGKLTGFGLVPGWSTDSSPKDSGVEASSESAAGSFQAFLMSGDPAIWQTTDYLLEDGDSLALEVSARVSWAADKMRMFIYYELFGQRVVVAEKTVTLSGSNATYSLGISAADIPEAIREQIGIGFANASSGSTWIALDNVHLWRVNKVLANEDGSLMPDGFALEQNFPNPFVNQTTIRYELSSAGHVQMKVFDLLGRNVATLVNNAETAGLHDVRFAGRDDSGQLLSSGVYVYQISVQEDGRTSTSTRSMMIVR